MKLKRQIPKHIYDRAEAANLDSPDFYVGPTLVEKEAPNGSPAAMHRNSGLQARMKEVKQTSDQTVARDKHVAKMAKRERRRAMIARLTRIFTRGRLGRTRAAR